MKYIIGVDAGTSNIKALAFDEGGNVIAESSRPCISVNDLPQGWHEQDPEQLLRLMLEVIKEIVSTAGMKDLMAISFSTAMHGVMAVDSKGKPLTNLITWADGRSTNYVQELKSTPEGQKIYEHTGTPLHAMSPLFKIRWIKEQLPDIFRLTHKFISVKEFFFFRLFNEFVVDHSIASATGLFDIETLKWHGPSLAFAGIQEEQLSRPVPTTYMLRGIKGGYAEMMGIDARIPLITGASDGCLANLGTNVLSGGDVCLTIGTSGAVRRTGKEPVTDPNGGLFNYILDDGVFVSGGPVNNGGYLLQWYSRVFLENRFSSSAGFDWFMDQVKDIPPGSKGLLFLPYIQGERAPVWDEQAKGVFIGIGDGHSQGHFMRAVIEGICFSLFEVFKQLETKMEDGACIYASGGFIHSKEWLQIIADIFGREMRVMNTVDASSLGAAILGMKAIGSINDLQEARRFFSVQDTIIPDISRHEVYGKYFDVFRGLYGKLKDDFHILHALSHEKKQSSAK